MQRQASKAPSLAVAAPPAVANSPPESPTAEPRERQPRKPVQSSVLRIYPAEVVVENVKDVPVSRLVTVKNVSPTIQTLRVKRPATSFFQIRGIPSLTVRLAPGMEFAFEVTFVADSEDDYFDGVHVCTADLDFEVPLHALGPKGRLSLSGDLDFGAIIHEASTEKRITITNTGKQKATWRAEFDGVVPIVLDPPKGGVPPGESRQVKVQYTAAELGSYSGRVDFYLGQGGTDSKLPTAIPFQATVVSQSFEMLDEKGNPLKSLDVGPCFYGSEIRRKLKVVNNGPSVAKYYVRIGPKADIDATTVDDEEIQDAAVAGVSIVSKLRRWKQAARNQTFTISPLDGVLEPYEVREITLKFRPDRKGDTAKGFTSQPSEDDGSSTAYSFATVVGFLGIKKNIKVDLGGQGIVPSVTIDPPVLRFGDATVGERLDIPVTVTNDSNDLACMVKLNPPSYFHVEPRQLLIPPGHSSSLLCWYQPKAMGKHSAAIQVDVFSEGASGSSPGVLNRTLECHGQAHGVTKASLRASRAPDALPEDFEPVRSFVEEDGWAPSGKGSAADGRARRRVRETSPLPRGGSERDMTEFSLTDREIVTKKAHENEYTEYMRRSAKYRKAAAETIKPMPSLKKKSAPMTADVLDPGLDLGIDMYSGLMAPMPSLPTEKDPLFIDTKYTDGSFVKPHNRALLIEEEAVLLAAAPAESEFPQGDMAKVCSTRLKTSEITSIAVGPRVIDFGKIATLSTTTRCLAVTNGFKKPIKISVDSHLFEELRESKPTTLVVKPGDTRGLPIVFMAKNAGKHALKLGYVINDYHFHSVTLLIEVVPVTLNVSSELLPFRFSPDNYGYEVKEMLTLSNPNSMRAEFSLELINPEVGGGANAALVEKIRSANGRFSFRPTSGVVNPKETLDVTITWRVPPSKTGAVSDETTMLLKVVGGQERAVKLTGTLPDSRVVSKEKEIDFGVFATGTSSTHSIVLRNRGANDASIVLDESILFALGDKLEISKKKARIGAGQSVEFELTLHLNEAEEIDEKVVFYVRGGKPVKVAMKAKAVIPDLIVESPRLDMGDVNIGGSCRRPLHFRNTGPVETVFHIDMKNAGQFRLELPRDGGGWNMEDYKNYPPLSKVRTEGGGVSPSQGSTMTIDDPSLEDRPIPEGHVYRLVVLPGNNLRLNLVYRPREVGRKDLELTCMVLGADESTYPVIDIQYNGLRPRLIVSDSIVDFSQRIILMDRQRKMPYTLEMSIKNNDRVPLKWHFGSPMVSVNGNDAINADWTSADDPFATPPLGAHTFSIEPRRGELGVKESANIRLHFLPKEPLSHEAVVPLYLDGEEKKSYLDLELRGQGRLPRLLFDVTEVVLAPTPLGVRTVQRFHVLNDGYTNLELQCKMPQDSNRIPISLHFPEGRMIGLAKNRLPVDVRFTSDKPMSFTAEIEVLDEDGNRYPLAVTGTADNSIFTTYSFVRANAAILETAAASEQSPVRLRIPEPVQLEPGHGKAAITEPFHMLNPFNPRACMKTDSLLRPRVVSSALARYFAATTGRKIDELAHDCSSSRGRLMIELIQRISGKQIQGVRGGNPGGGAGVAAAQIGGVKAMETPSIGGGSANANLRKFEQTENLLKSYDAMLSFLKSHGCLLNIVKAEMLLDGDDLKRAVEYRETVLEPAGSRDDADVVAADEHGVVKAPSGAILESWRSLENQRDHVNAVAWHYVYSQIVKVFVAQKINNKTIRTFPGIGDPNLLLAAAGFHVANSGAGDQSSPNARLAEKRAAEGGNAEEEAKPENPALASNLYSSSELLLLGWCTAHFQAALPAVARRVTNFSYDFNDGLVIYALLVRHWPAFEALAGSIKKDVVTDADRHANCANVAKMCEDLGLVYKLTAEELFNPDERDMLIFVLYLSQMLPMYVPCAVVQFTANVAREMVNNIELSNPSSRPIHYVARIVGHEDFTVATTFVNVEPKEKAFFEIKCTPSTTRQTNARLILTPTGIDEGGALASVLCFELRNQADESDPLETLQMAAKAYEMRTRELMVQNPFPYDVELAITYNPCPVPKPPEPELTEQEKKELERKEKKAAMERARKGKPAKVEVPLSELLQPNPDEPQKGPGRPLPFAVDRKTLRLKQGETGKLVVSYLPWDEGQEAVKIRFEEKDYGAFSYMIVGTAQTPNPTVTQKLSFELDEEAVHDISIPIPFNNSLCDSARRIFLERHPLAKNKEMAEMCRNAVQDTPHELMYLVRRENPFVNGPKVLTIFSKDIIRAGSNAAQNKVGPAGEGSGSGDGSGDGAAGDGAGSAAGAEDSGATNAGTDGAAAEGEQSQGMMISPAGGASTNRSSAQHTNVLQLRFAPRKAGSYPCKIVLQGLYDIRVVDIDITVPAPQMVAKLDFEGPCRSQMLQMIPLVNAGERPLTVRANLTGADSFSGPREVTVPASSSGEYPLKFYGRTAGEYLGNLQLSVGTSSSDRVNPNEQSKYELRGLCQAPLAESRIEFDCHARTESSITLRVPNVVGGREVRYSVFTDISFVSGGAELVVPAAPAPGTGGGHSSGAHNDGEPKPPPTTEYKLRALPPRSGLYTGCVTFLDTMSGQYCWFVLDVRVSRPPAEDIVRLKCPVREAVVASVSVSNPLDYDVTFAVSTVDCPGVIVEPTFEIASKSSSTFDVIFSPLVPGHITNGLLFFSSDIEGEFWYRIDAEAEPAAPIALAPMTSEVGLRTETTVSVTNPTAEEIVLSLSSDNPRNFVPNPAAGLVLPPFGTGEVHIEYAPSSLGTVERGVVSLSHRNAGTWEYEISGTGTPPTTMEETNISCVVSQSATAHLAFRNPFSYSLVCDVRLEQSGEKSEPFKLLIPTRKSARGYTVAPFGQLTIPLVYSPDEMRESRGSVVIDAVPRTPADAAIESSVDDDIPPSEASTDTLSTAVAGGAVRWTYPIVGVAEAAGVGAVLRFEGKARRRLDETFEVTLSGLTEENHGEEFTCKVLADAEHAAALAKSLFVTPLSDKIDLNAPLRFRLTFTPLKTMQAQVAFVVTKASGGRWRFVLQLDVSGPEPDGRVVVTAAVHEIGSTALAIRQEGGTPVKFEAKILDLGNVSSIDELTVSPTSGTMPTDGPLILNIGYAPVEYGKESSGLLVVTSDQQEWTYMLRGTLPAYVPPAVGPKVSTNLGEKSKTALSTAIKHGTHVPFVKQNLSLKDVKRHTTDITGKDAASSAISFYHLGTGSDQRSLT
ncbi:FAP-47 protein [Pseudoscourfieldia marina]